MSDSLVVIPTYNEKENIEKIIRKVFSMNEGFHILIVEDNSPDGTAAIVKKLIPEFANQLFIEERKGKLGLGTAYVHGFKWALERGYQYILEMDADFSHNPEDLVRLRAACRTGADVAVGSRYVKGVSVVYWPMGRILMSFFASKYVKFVTGLNITDTTAGFVCYKREVLEHIGLDDIKFVGYAFQVEMKYKSWKMGYHIKEVPIIFTDRTEGTSKMNSGIFKEAVWGVIQLRLMAMTGKIKNKKDSRK